MDPSMLAVADTIGPWYQRLAQEVGPLAATLFVFLAAFGWVAWRIAIAVIKAWHVEGDRYREDMKNERELHRKDIDNLVIRLDERDKFQRDELMGIVRGYEKIAMTQIKVLEKVEGALDPLTHAVMSRPCMLTEQKHAILEAARLETQQTIQRLEGHRQ